MTAALEFVPVEKTFRGDGWSVSAAMQPAIHVEEFVVRPGERIPPSPPPAGVSDRPVERYRHRTRHLAPPRQTPQGFFTREQPRPVWIHEFEIPLGEVRESAWNTVALGSAGRGPEFLHFGGGCQPLTPAEPCRCRNVAG